MEENQFKVRDRRIDHQSDDAPAAPVGDETETPPEQAPVDRAATAEGDGFSMADQSRSIDFTAFAFSLAQMALVFMGLEPHPDGEKTPVNLDAARQNIDILSMLEEKTRGNLTAEEAEFISKLLYTLRMGFVEVSKAHSAS